MNVITRIQFVDKISPVLFKIKLASLKALLKNRRARRKLINTGDTGITKFLKKIKP